MSRELKRKILRRDPVALTELYTVISDSKCKAACLAVLHVQTSVERLDSLVDPEVRDIPRFISEQTLAAANKKWFALNRNNILSAMNSLSIAEQEDIMSLADSGIAVEEATDLNGNLTKLFSAILKSFENITQSLAALESTEVNEEILVIVAELRKVWANLKILVSNQVTVPSAFALREEVRDETIKRLAALVDEESQRMQKEKEAKEKEATK